jgi:multisubunit Na+/H+ antiporter MnhB subunit
MSLLRLVLGVLAGLSALLIAAVALRGPQHAGLDATVTDALDVSGVEHGVTAVLLNFRSLDTLLEVAVLLVAVLAAAALPATGERRERRPVENPMVDWLVPRLVIFSVLMAAYLFWAGSTRSGGAFQGGTVLAAAGILLLLAARWRQPPGRLLWRALLSLGLLAFLSFGQIAGLFGGGILVYPPATAGALILAIELALTLSIGTCLFALVSGARGAGDE